EGERGRAALAKAVDAEAREVLGGVGDVELAVFVEGRELGRNELGDRCKHGIEVDLRKRRKVPERRKLAVASDDGWTADLEMNVARADLDGAPQHSVQFHNGACRQPDAGS